MTNPSTPVMEIVTFRLTSSANHQALRDAAKTVDTLLAENGGSLARTLVVDDDHLWTDMVIWTSLEVAQKAAETLPADPRFAAFGALIAPDTITMRHAAIQHQME